MLSRQALHICKNNVMRLMCCLSEERGRGRVKGRLDFLPYELETCLLSTTLIKVNV